MKKKFTSLQQGFTLVELMVALVLGLLVTAAAIQLFITGQMSLNTQKGMADLQESGNFGLRYITNDLRKTNYGNVNIVNDRLANGGIVLTTRHTPHFVTSASSTYNATNIPVNIDMMTVATAPVAVEIPVTSHATGNSNVQILSDPDNPDSARIDQASDQLVIQFYADRDGTDCEGNKYLANRYVIERFFLRADSNAASNEPNTALVLACEAGSYIEGAAKIIKNPTASTTVFGTTSGEIIVRRVDHLHFLLGISNNANTGDLRYITIHQYLTLDQNPRPRINSIQIGMLVRSNESTNANNLINNNQKFSVLDQTVTVKVPMGTSPKYLRRVIIQTIALRNAFISTDTAVM